MAIFDDLEYCKSSKRRVGGPKKVKKNDDVILEWSPRETASRKKKSILTRKRRIYFALSCHLSEKELTIFFESDSY